MYNERVRININNWRENHRDEYNAYMRTRNKIYREKNHPILLQKKREKNAFMSHWKTLCKIDFA